jgi:hypothetical protein
MSAFAKSIERARARAEERHLPAAEAAYARLIRRSGRYAAETLRAQAVTAAANWQPPPEGILFQTSAIAPTAAGALSNIHKRIVAAVAGPPLERIGIAWDVSHPLSVELLEGAAQRTGERLGEAVQPVLREAVAEAYAQGLSVPQASSLIRDRIEEAAPWQAEMLARTDLNGLSNGGSVMAAKLAGIATKTWLTSWDGEVRPEHQAAQGQTVPIDQPFLVGGEALAFPGDPAGSDANTANCRCVVLLGETQARTAAANEGDEMTTIAEGNAKTYAAVAAPVRWQAVLAVEGEPTEDGRLLAPGSITWRDTPLPLMAQLATADGHDGAQVAGRIDEIWRDAPNIMGAGVFDTGDFGTEITRLVGEQTLRGVSVDLAVREFEVQLLDGEGEPVDGDLLEQLAEGVDELFVVTDGVIGAATICPFQAIGKASISLAASADQTEATFSLEDARFSFPGPTMDERIASALGTLEHVSAMRTELARADQRAADLEQMVENVRQQSAEATLAQKSETLAMIEAMTAQIAQSSKPRSIRVIRDDNGRATGYEEG